MPTAPILKLVHQIRPQNTDLKAAVGWGVTAGLAALWLIQVSFKKPKSNAFICKFRLIKFGPWWQSMNEWLVISI